MYNIMMATGSSSKYATELPLDQDKENLAYTVEIFNPDNSANDIDTAICMVVKVEKPFLDSCNRFFRFPNHPVRGSCKKDCPLCNRQFAAVLSNCPSSDNLHIYFLCMNEQVLLLIDEYRNEQEMSPSTSRQEDSGVRFKPTYLANRRRVYMEDLYAKEISLGAGHTITPRYFTDNPKYHKMLLPFMLGELRAILANYDSIVLPTFVYIGFMMFQEPVLSKEFRWLVRPLLGKLTRHFQHEIACFCVSQLPMREYKKVVRYRRKPVDRSRFGKAGNLDDVDVRIPFGARRYHNHTEDGGNHEESDSDDCSDEFVSELNIKTIRNILFHTRR